MQRVDILGFTLAEIAFVLLFAFLAILASSDNRQRHALGALSMQAAALAARTKELASENDRLKNTNQELAKENSEQRRHLRSIVTPSCAETGLNVGWLFTAVVRGANKYEIDGRMFSLDEIKSAYADDISAGRSHGCVQRIKVYCGSGVNGVDYEVALRRIEELFYTKKLGGS